MKEKRKKCKILCAERNRKLSVTRTSTLCSKDLGDPPKNLEKDFILKGKFFPQDYIFPAE